MHRPRFSSHALAVLLAGGILLPAASALACKDTASKSAALELHAPSGPGTLAYALVTDDGQTIFSSGESRDWQSAQAYHEQHPGDLMWVRDRDRRYVLRDPQVLSAALASIAPVTDLANEETKLGDLQTRLGDEQSRLGDEQAQLGDRQTEIGDRMSELAERMASVTDAAARRAIQSDIDAARRDQLELSRSQLELVMRERNLARNQLQLANQQKRLARMKAELSIQLRESLVSLLQTAIRAGAAEKI